MPSLLSIKGKPAFLLGVNYWSRAGGPRMWDRFDANVVSKELAQMRRIGLNACRSFAFIPSFMPNPPALSKTALQHFQTFLELCRKKGMGTLPSFLVGHMSGENYDFPGQNGRSPYTDEEILDWEKQLVRGLAGVAASHPMVIAYLASNEMPLWGGASDPPTISAWAQTLRQTLREADPRGLFSLGDGVMNLKGGQNGFDVTALRSSLDFVGPHTYYTDADPLRQAYNAEFCIRSVTHLGLPVLFEEFGCSSCQVSKENQALYYREVIHACLSAGAAGALGWCYSDFDLAEEPPYRHHAFELSFGITRSDGSEKPVCEELRRISAFIAGLDYPALQHPKPRAALLVPSYFNTTYPFSWENRDRMRRTLLQAYALCADAGLETELVPEGNDLSPYRLVLAPSTQKLLAPTWKELLDHAARGNTIYWSYFSGDHGFHQGAWCTDFEELTGCRHELRYGCYDLPQDTVRLEGGGLSMSLRTTVGDPFPRSLLPVRPTRAEILARDHLGRPALTRMRHGQGQMLFLNHPWEYYLAEQIDGVLSSSSGGLYRLLAEHAGLCPGVRCSTPGVQVRVVGSPSARLLWVINHRWETVTADVDSPGGKVIHGPRSPLREGNRPIELKAKQVSVYRLHPS